MKHRRSSVDFKEVASRALERAETLVPQWLPGGRRSGAEWVCGGLNGEPGRSLSVNLNTGVWSDFATGAKGGDLIRLLAEIRGCDQPTAAAEIDPSLARSLNGSAHRPAPAADFRAAPKPASDWVPIIPVPDSAPEPPAWLSIHREHGPAVASWAYRTRDGGLIGHIIRFNQADGGKEFRPATWCDGPDGKQEWRAKSFPEPRPLYGLEFLKPEGPVYLVEGEKSADALRRMIPDACVLSWPGGSNAVSKADFSPLAGRQVIIWPDADSPGLDAASVILDRLPQARIVDVGGDRPQGWDAGDAEAEGWTESDARALLANLLPVKESEVEQDQDRAPAADRHLPFRMLGKADGRYFYQPHKGMEVVGLSPSAHVKLNLLDLAALQDWEAEFPSKSGVDWDSAVNAMLQRSAVLPKFDPRRVRGRGCWIDGGDTVFHAGGRLIVNGTEQDIRVYQSPTGAIYEGALEIPTYDAEPASNAEGIRLLELCGMLPWERPLSGILLAGWLALAPICGALVWRPHVWVTGPSGSGKSWTVSNVITPMVGKTCLAVQGNTTEAGIRGMLRSDALPIVFDEAESENAAGMARLDKVLELARQASSEGGAVILKGTSGGGSVSYLVRSMFLFASIGTAATKKADTSRISVLELRKSNDQENFESIKALWAETVMRPAYSAAIRARSMANVVTIRKNAETFSEAAAEILGDKRTADQIGALLAGYHSLKSTQPITLEAARDFMSRQDWEEHQPDAVDSDESRCFSHLMDSTVILEHGARAPIGELVAKAESGDADAQAELKRHGLKVQDGRLWVANRHALLDVVFRDTPWAAEKWGRQLARMPGARKEAPSKFGHMCTQRAVSICPEKHRQG